MKKLLSFITVIALLFGVAYQLPAQLKIGETSISLSLDRIILSGGYYHLLQGEPYIDKATGPGGDARFLFNLTDRVGFSVGIGYYSMMVTETETPKDEPEGFTGNKSNYPWMDYDDAVMRWEWGEWYCHRWSTQRNYYRSANYELAVKVKERSNVTPYEIALTFHALKAQKLNFIVYTGVGFYPFRRVMWFEEEFGRRYPASTMSDAWQAANPDEDYYWEWMDFRTNLPPKRGTAYAALGGGCADLKLHEYFGLMVTVQYNYFYERQDFFPFDSYLNANVGLSIYF